MNRMTQTNELLDVMDYYANSKHPFCVLYKHFGEE